MQQRTLPGTDLRLSLLGFGNFTLGEAWWGQFSDADAVALQNAALDHGVTFFDTAPAYGSGRAERLIRDTLRHAGRDRITLSTKFGYEIPGMSVGVTASAVTAPSPHKTPDLAHREKPQDFSPAAVRRQLEDSLARMGTDYIDLYQAHNIKLPQYRDDLFDTLNDLQKQGKIRAWGVALGPAIGWREEGYQAFLKHDAATVQSVFNLYEQDPGREFCHIAQRLGRGGVIARVPTNSGILDEEFTNPDHRFPPSDHRKFRDRNWLVYGLQKNQIIRSLARDCGGSLRQFAFRFLASFPTVVSIEPNILTLRDITDFASASDMGPLPHDVLVRLAELYDTDFGLGPDAHPCDWKSSTDPTGKVRSSYQDPTPMLATV